MSYVSRTQSLIVVIAVLYLRGIESVSPYTLYIEAQNNNAATITAVSKEGSFFGIHNPFHTAIQIQNHVCAA